MAGHLTTPIKIDALLACARADAMFSRRDPWRRYEVFKKAAARITSSSEEYEAVIADIAAALDI